LALGRSFKSAAGLQRAIRKAMIGFYLAAPA
jgi:hypothetical protein